MRTGAAPSTAPALEERRYKGYMVRRAGTRWVVHRSDGTSVLWAGKLLVTFAAAKRIINYDVKS